jgi:hypothetical protein
VSITGGIIKREKIEVQGNVAGETEPKYPPTERESL